MAEAELTNKERRKARKAERAQAKEGVSSKKTRKEDSEADVADSPAPPAADEPEPSDKERRKARKAERAQAKEDASKKRRSEEDEADDGDVPALESAADEPVMTNKERRMARKAERTQARESASKKRNAAELDSEKVQESADEPEAADALEAPEALDEDTPLSHKERRKRRKMEKVEARAAAEPESSRAAPARPKRSPYSVWIGNMAFSTTQDELTAWLTEHGIEGISRVHMPQGARRSEHNKGYVGLADSRFAYVDLPSQAQVEACMALSEESLAGRRLLIKSGSDYTGRPGLDPTALTHSASATGGRTGLTKTAQKILHAQRNPPAPTLFMGNLSFETTEEAIRELLDGSAQRRYVQDHPEKEEEEEEGEPPGAGISKIRMGTFEDTGKCKGYVCG